jgi:hypothetical protein
VARTKKADNEGLSLGIIEELRKKGYNQSEIAEMYGVTRQAVSWHKVEYGGHLTTRQVVNLHWPWETTNAHSKTSVYMRMRDLGEYMATGGKGMSFGKLRRLRGWLIFLRDNDVVLEFDPDIPPQPGFAPSGGFAYRKRCKSDGDLVIRKNKYTRLTPEGKMIWKFPHVFPHENGLYLD